MTTCEKYRLFILEVKYLKKVEKESPLPLHYQLKQIILEMIENELLKPGDSIPPERELCDTQGVSRMTVNKAIFSLVNEGVLYREQGKGTFVAKPKINQNLSDLKGFTEEMREKGLNPISKVLFFEIKAATKQNKQELNMSEEHDLVIEMTRLRKVDEEPFALETVLIPYHICPDMTRESVEGKSLYATLTEEYNYRLDKAKQTIEPIQLNEYEAKLLNQNDNALALLFRRTTYLQDGTPVEYTKEIYRSDKYKYEIVLK